MGHISAQLGTMPITHPLLCDTPWDPNERYLATISIKVDSKWLLYLFFWFSLIRETFRYKKVGGRCVCYLIRAKYQFCFHFQDVYSRPTRQHRNKNNKKKIIKSKLIYTYIYLYTTFIWIQITYGISQDPHELQLIVHIIRTARHQFACFLVDFNGSMIGHYAFNANGSVSIHRNHQCTFAKSLYGSLTFVFHKRKKYKYKWETVWMDMVRYGQVSSLRSYHFVMGNYAVASDCFQT